MIFGNRVKSRGRIFSSAEKTPGSRLFQTMTLASTREINTQ